MTPSPTPFGTRDGANHRWSYPVPAPDGTFLSLDVGISPAHADRPTLLVTSGLHGVECPAGAALQRAFLEQPSLRSDCHRHVRAVLIHALNPHGFAAGRRVNEDNVDLNRNFLVPGQEYRGSPAVYAALDPCLNPARPPGGLRPMWPTLLKHSLRFGIQPVKQAVAGGQHDYPQGIFFGGEGPSPTCRLLHTNLVPLLRESRRVLHLDVHTGLGRWKELTMLGGNTGGVLSRSALQAFPASWRESPARPTAYTARGEIGAWCAHALGSAGYVHFCAEFGTLVPMRVLAALRDENQAWHCCNPDDPRRQRAARRLARVFVPRDTEWRRHLVETGLECLRRAVAWLDDANGTGSTS